MRVIDQARLWFREGTSDKVYEVDLVEVAVGQYVVNFRFGRRGAALKDGTKTSLPVTMDKARGIFTKLVDEKLAGGYAHAGQPAPPRPPPATTPLTPTVSVVHTSVAHRAIAALQLGARSPQPLGPVVWQVTDLDLKEAEPVLLELVAASFVPKKLTRDAWRHLLVTALVRCGGQASVPALTQLATSLMGQGGAVATEAIAHHVRDMARIALARIAPAAARDIARGLLTPALLAAYDKGDAQALARLAEEQLGLDAIKARTYAVALYMLDDNVARPAVLAVARVARLSNAEASTIRTLFRLAEARRDGELYALLARRIDAYSAPRRPFSPKTRQYLRRRVARVLRRLGRAESPDYVRMSASILLGYDDEDAVPAKRGLFGHQYETFSPFHAFNQILYTHSPRFEKSHHTKSAWRVTRAWRPNAPPPAQREEAFPQLWDRAPDVLWALILKSGATPVIEFATRALRANRAYCDALRDDQIASVLAMGHPLAQEFAFDIARTRPLTITLARAALASDVAAAHRWVTAWIEQHADEAATDPDLVAMLVTGKTQQIREAALDLVRKKALDPNVARSAAARAIAILLGLANTPTNAERASGAVTAMMRVLEPALRELGPEVLRDMVKHPLAGLGELAGEIILRHAQRDSLPGDVLEAMLASPHATVRTLGGRLLAATPPEVAKDDLEALVLFAASGNAELREATRTLLGKIAAQFPDVGRALADQLVDALLRTLPPGAPAHIVSLLRAELAAVLPKKSAETILRLIGALSPHARDAGGLLLPQLTADDIGLDDINRLASHENKAVREGAWTLARNSVDRYRIAPVALAKLVDSSWEDTRAFAIAFIDEHIGQLTADAIITICDSVRPDVQDLGKQLLHRQFREADAGRYLVRLAEHPSTNLQLLVSGLLDRHAGDVDKLRTLVPYFAVVLSQVNRGRVAKERVMALLRREAGRSAEHAGVLAPLLERQSATAAITQKAPIIATMVDVHHQFPDVPLPIKVTAPKGAES
ncbi:MAG TPA: hypothetical protein VL326_28165 [Kofleriaceae bacterium]|nr:hypothetical protein [Kofleriaceae bacterium]